MANQNKDALITVGFNTDVPAFVKEIKKQLSSVKDWGLSDSIKDEIDEIQSMLDSLSKSFAEGMSSKLDMKTFAGFEKVVTANMNAIDGRVTKLEGDVEELYKVLNSGDGGEFSNFVKDLVANMDKLRTVVGDTTAGIGELTKAVGSSGGKIQFVDTTDVKRLDKEIDMLHDMQDIIQDITNNKFDIGSIVLPKDYRKSVKKIKQTYNELIEIQENLEEQLSRENVDELAVTRLQDKYLKAFANLKGMRNQMEFFEDLDKIPKDVFDFMSIGEDKVIEFSDRVIDRLEAISKARASLGKQSALSMGDNGSLKVPLDVSTTGKGLSTKALNVIKIAQKAVDEYPLEIQFKLISKYSSRKTNELLKDFQDSVANISNSKIRKKFEGLYESIAKDFQKEINIQVTSNIDDEQQKVLETVEKIKSLVGEKVHIFPKFDIQETEVKEVQAKLDKLSEQLTLNVSNIGLKDDPKEKDLKLEALTSLAESLKTIENLSNESLEPMRKSLARIVELTREMWVVVDNVPGPMKEVVDSVNELVVTIQKAFGIFTKEDLEGMFQKMKTTVEGINGDLRGGDNNKLVLQLKEILALYRQYKDLGGGKDLLELGGAKNVQKWLSNHANDEVLTKDPYVVEGENNAAGYALGIRSGIPEVKEAAKELVEAAIEAVREAQDSNSPAKRTVPLGKDFASGIIVGVKEKAKELKEAASKMVKDTVDESSKETATGIEKIVEETQKAAAEIDKAQKPLDEWTQNTLAKNAEQLGLKPIEKLNEGIQETTESASKFAESMQEVASEAKTLAESEKKTVPSVKEISDALNKVTDLSRDAKVDSSKFVDFEDSLMELSKLFPELDKKVIAFIGESTTLYSAFTDISDASNILHDSLEKNLDIKKFLNEGVQKNLLNGSELDTRIAQVYNKDPYLKKLFNGIGITLSQEKETKLTEEQKKASDELDKLIDEAIAAVSEQEKALDKTVESTKEQTKANEELAQSQQEVTKETKGSTGKTTKKKSENPISEEPEKVAKVEEEIKTNATAATKAIDNMYSKLGEADKIADDVKSIADEIAKIINNSESLQKVDSPFAAKKFNRIKGVSYQKDKPDAVTAKNVLTFTKAYMESGQADILPLIKKYVEGSSLRKNLKDSLTRILSSAMEESVKEAANTAKEAATETVVMNQKQLKEYLKKYAVWKDSEDFNHNFKAEIEAMQKDGRAVRPRSKTGKLKPWQYSVEVPVNQINGDLEKVEKKVKETTKTLKDNQTQSEDTTKALSNVGSDITPSLQKHIDKYKELYNERQDYLQGMAEMATDQSLFDPEIYKQAKSEADKVARQMQKEWEKVYKNFKGKDLRSLALGTDSTSTTTATVANEEKITKALQKHIDKYKALYEERQVYLEGMSAMAANEDLFNPETYKQASREAESLFRQMQKEWERVYKNFQGRDLRSLALGLDSTKTASANGQAVVEEEATQKITKALQKRIDKYKELEARRNELYNKMSPANGDFNPEEYKKLKSEVSSVENQMQKESERVYKNFNGINIRDLALGFSTLEEASKRTAISEEKTLGQISEALQKKIDRYKEYKDKITSLYNQMSAMINDSGKIADVEAYKKLRQEVESTEAAMRKLSEKAFKGWGIDLKSFIDGTSEINGAADAIKNEGEEAKKAVKKKEKFAKANKKVADASSETASETEKAAKAIEKEYKHAEKMRDKVIAEENAIRQALADAPQREQEGYTSRLEKVLEDLDGNKFAKRFTSSFQSEIDSLVTDIGRMLDSGNIVGSEVDDIENRFKALARNLRKDNLPSILLGEDSGITGLSAKIATFLEQNTAMSRKFRKELEQMFARLRSGAEISKEELTEMDNRFKEITGDVKMLHQTGPSILTSFAKQLKSANAQLLATYFSFQDFIRYIREGFQTIVEVDTALTELRKVSDADDVRLAESFKQSTETAKELGATISDVINVTADWARLNNLGLVKFSQNGETPEEDNPVGNYMICFY